MHFLHDVLIKTRHVVHAYDQEAQSIEIINTQLTKSIN